MNRLRSLFKYAMAAAVSFTAVACSSDSDDFIFGGGGTPPATTLSDVSSRIEVPRLNPQNKLITHWTTEGQGKVMNYCLEYDAGKYHSRWVAYRFDNLTRQVKVGRKPYEVKPQYPKDPSLISQYIPDDASFNGYQHGHLCASADRLYSRASNDQTFYMTNMSPQKGDFNGGYWTRFESFVREKAKAQGLADTLYVVKGGTITEGDYSHRVANSRIVVPKYYFMALLQYRFGKYSAIGFWMGHDSHGYSYNNQAPRSELNKRAVSIQWLENRTGIDFFHNLPDAIEKKVEKELNLSDWGL